MLREAGRVAPCRLLKVTSPAGCNITAHIAEQP
jgi:hypothetical protein